MEKDPIMNRRQFLANTSFLSAGMITSLPIVDSYTQNELKKNLAKDLRAGKVKVVGVGGAGGNGINNLGDVGAGCANLFKGAFMQEAKN